MTVKRTSTYASLKFFIVYQKVLFIFLFFLWEHKKMQLTSRMSTKTWHHCTTLLALKEILHPKCRTTHNQLPVIIVKSCYVSQKLGIQKHGVLLPWHADKPAALTPSCKVVMAVINLSANFCLFRNPADRSTLVSLTVMFQASWKT